MLWKSQKHDLQKRQVCFLEDCERDGRHITVDQADLRRSGVYAQQKRRSSGSQGGQHSGELTERNKKKNVKND